MVMIMRRKLFLGISAVSFVLIVYFNLGQLDTLNKLNNNNNNNNNNINGGGSIIIKDDLLGKQTSQLHSQSGDQLVAVFMYVRHGARTPLHLTPGIEEASYKEDLLKHFVLAYHQLVTIDGQDFTGNLSSYDMRTLTRILEGGAPRGQLTNVGEKQLYDLGLIEREKYANKLKFVSLNYDEKEVYVRSTHYMRTINSAKAFLTGFSGRHPINLNELKYKIHINEYETDILYPNPNDCDSLKEYRQNMIVDHDLFRNNEQYQQNLKELYSILGVEYYPDPEAFTKFRDDMTAREVHDLPIPDNLRPLIKKYDRFAAMELAANVHDKDVTISCGQLLDLLKRNLFEAKEGFEKKTPEKYYKINYYSTHDSTVMALLIAMDLINERTYRWPPFAASLKFELWSSSANNNKESKNPEDERFFIRAFYLGQPVKLTFCSNIEPNDPTKCKLSEFINRLSIYAIDRIKYSEMCYVDYPTSFML